MKVIKNEEFISPERRQAHYNKHVSSKKYGEFKDGDYKSSFDYERMADHLAATPVKTSDVKSSDEVVGFIENRDDEEMYVKFNKTTGALVVYRPSSRMRSGNLIKTYFKADKDKYNKLFDSFYVREINND